MKHNKNYRHEGIGTPLIIKSEHVKLRLRNTTLQVTILNAQFKLPLLFADNE